MDYSSNVALCLNRAAAGSLTRKLSHLSKEKEENVQILALFRECPAYILLYQFSPKDTGQSKVK